jgi:hypothetical protein
MMRRLPTLRYPWRNDDGAASIRDNGDIDHAHIIANAGVIPDGWHIV